MAFNIPDYYQVLAGAVYIAEIDPDTTQIDRASLQFIGDASELTLELSQDYWEHLEHQSGWSIKDVRLPNRAGITGQITLDSTGIDNFRRFLYAKLSSTPVGTVTNEPYTAAEYVKLDAWCVNEWVSLTSNPVGTTYEQGKDYEIDGTILRIVPGGGISPGDSLYANYVAGSAIQADLFGERFKYLFLYFKGRNIVNQEEVGLELYKVSFDPATLGNLLGDDVIKMTMPFEALEDTIRSNYELDIFGDRLGDPTFGGFGRYIVLDYSEFYALKVDKDAVYTGQSSTISYASHESADYTITGVDSDDIDGASLTGTLQPGDRLTINVTVNADMEFNLALDNGEADITIQIVGGVFYCPQSVPDYLIDYTIVYTNDVTNYCPQDVPDYAFAQAP